MAGSSVYGIVKLSLAIHRAEVWHSHTAVLTRHSGSADQTVSVAWSMVIWFELTRLRAQLINYPSSRQSHRMAKEECGSPLDVTACTAWPMVYGPRTVAATTFPRQAWSLSSPTAWAACGLGTRRASLRFWTATMCRYLTATMASAWVTSPRSTDAGRKSGLAASSGYSSSITDPSATSEQQMMSCFVESRELLKRPTGPLAEWLGRHLSRPTLRNRRGAEELGLSG